MRRDDRFGHGVRGSAGQDVGTGSVDVCRVDQIPGGVGRQCDDVGLDDGVVGEHDVRRRRVHQTTVGLQRREQRGRDHDDRVLVPAHRRR